MRNQDPSDGPVPPPGQQASDSHEKSHEELCRAPNNWCRNNRLGKGGEGAVYLGENPADPSDKWAVKRLLDGEGDAKKFELEVSAHPPVHVCDTLSLTCACWHGPHHSDLNS